MEQAVTTDTWFVIALSIWLVIMLTTFVLFILRRRTRMRRAMSDRPIYEQGESYSICAWERACERSLNWSQQRRSG